MSNITREEFDAIFECEDADWEGDNAMQGLQIIAKYMDGMCIEGADHDVIYSVDVDELIDAGITKEDVKSLVGLNWMIEQGEFLACFI